MSGELKKALVATHPWHAKMSGQEEWPTMRAVLGALNDPKVKAARLPKGAFERADHHAVRVELSQFLGVSEGILDRFVGAIFREDIEVDYKGQAELEAWAENVDGQGTTLRELIEDRIAEEAAGMGIVGVFVDRFRPTEGALAAFSARTGRDRPLTKADDTELGIRLPRLVVYQAEEITDWSCDDRGRLEWVKLRRVVSTRKSALDGRSYEVEWLVLDRVNASLYRAKVKETSRVLDENGPNGLPLVKTDLDIEEPVLVEGIDHGCGRVPFEVFYGRKLGPMRGASVLRATARADIAGFTEDSHGTFHRYLHNVPAFFMRVAGDVAEVVKNASAGFKLDPDRKEEIGYVSTPSEAFEVGMHAVETRRLDGYRQAGADPTGMFEGTTQSESGRAKTVRFGNTEARVLAKLAKGWAASHWSVLELAARRLATEVLSIEQNAYAGTVRYPARFEQEGADDLIARYLEAGPYIESETWHRGMLRRTAMAIRGETSAQEAKKIAAELDALPFEKILARFRAATAAASAMGDRGPTSGDRTNAQEASALDADTEGVQE